MKKRIASKREDLENGDVVLLKFRPMDEATRSFVVSSSWRQLNFFYVLVFS